MIRTNGRTLTQLRPITFETGFTKWAEGSVLAYFGSTQVLCNVTIEENLPAWLGNLVHGYDGLNGLAWIFKLIYP